jgi:hypothetical protein
VNEEVAIFQKKTIKQQCGNYEEDSPQRLEASETRNDRTALRKKKSLYEARIRKVGTNLRKLHKQLYAKKSRYRKDGKIKRGNQVAIEFLSNDQNLRNY